MNHSTGKFTGAIVAETVTETLEDQLESEILGSLNVTRYSLLVGSHQGALPTLFCSANNQASNLVPKAVPVLQIPPAPQRFVGRKAEITAAIDAIQTGRSLEIVGSSGMGKSAFLRYLAHRPEVTTSHPDGILYLHQYQPLDDFVQSLGERFYLVYPDSKLTIQEWQISLQELQVLLILADPQWLLEDVQALQRILPNSTILLASLMARSLTQFQSVKLLPLSLEATQQLASQILSDPSAPIDAQILEQSWRRFQGQPGRLVQLLLLIQQGHLSWQDCQKCFLTGDSSRRTVVQNLVRQEIAVLSTPQRWIVGLLSALDGVGLTVQQIASITGPQEPQSSLQGLVRLGLVQPLDGRYRLSEHLRAWVAQEFDSQPWMERGVAVFSDWLTQQPPELILPELPLAMVLLRWAVQQKRWALVLSMARSLDAALVLGKQWEAWQRVLQWALQAAWQLEAIEAEAWAWHQLGVRALCLEDVTTAYDALNQALRLRQGLQDPQAIALTQRCLNHTVRGAVPRAVRTQVQQEGSRWRTNMVLLVISLITFVIALLLGLGVRQWLQPAGDGSLDGSQGEEPSEQRF
jgi:hypothetical protein